jgi:long-subunit fatty acid transport protein
MLTGTRRPRAIGAGAGLMAAIVLAAGTTASAQSTAQIPLRFDFLTPGARSLAMGGAFLGAADDATAAFSNPAGLARLRRIEVSIEGRFRRTETSFLAGGRISGSITGRGLDTVAGPVYGTDVDARFGPAFVSVVAPAGRIRWAAYRHELARSDNTFQSDGVFERLTFAGVTNDENRDIPLAGRRRIAIDVYGGSLAVSLSPRVAVGGGLSAAHLSLQSSFARLGLTSLYGAVDPADVSATAIQDAHDTAVAANAGVSWRVNRRVTIGAAVRRGPAFTFTQEDRVFDQGVDLVRAGRFKVPDVWGAGVEWRPAEAWRVLADYDYVRYAQLKADFLDFQAIASNRADRVRIDNGHEWHGGVEYQRLNGRVPLALRGGIWSDPDHVPRYVAAGTPDEEDVLLAATLPGGHHLVHYTFGLGVLAAGVEINGGADLSSAANYATMSAVFRF